MSLRRCWLVHAGVLFSLTVILLLAQFGGSADAMQVGAYPAGTGPIYGARSDISAPASVINGTYARVYNVGLTLPDGSFIQVGYVDLASSFSECGGGQGLAWFVTMLTPNGGYSGPKLWNIGGCGLSGNHMFAIVQDGQSGSSGQYDWGFNVSGVPTRYYYTSPYGHTPRPNTIIFTEIVDPNDVPTGTAFPTDNYSVALQVKQSDGSWGDISNGLYYGTNDAVCPPFKIKSTGPDDAQTYKDATGIDNCHPLGGGVW